MNATVERLGKRGLRESGGDWHKAEALFEGYLGRVQNRFTRTGSGLGVEIQPAALRDGTRVPPFIHFLNGDGSLSRLYAFPKSRRLDATIVDTQDITRGVGGSYPRVLSGFDITLNRTKPNRVQYYQEFFGDIDISDIRLP